MADVKVKDVMTNLVVMLYPGDTVHDAAQRFARNGISGAPVVEAGKIVGIVSEADLIHAVMPPAKVDRGTSVLDMLSVMTTARPRAHRHGIKVSEIMTSIVCTIGPEDSIWKAANEMETRGVKRLPVIDGDDYVIGIVSRADVVKAMAHDDARIREEVLGAISVLGDDVIDELDAEVQDGIVTLLGSADRRSTHELAIKLAGRSPGVVEVIDEMSHEHDDHQPRVPRSEDVLAPSALAS